MKTQINNTQPAQPHQIEHAAGQETSSVGLLGHLSNVIDAVDIDHSSLKAFMGVAGSVKDGVFALKNAYSSIAAFGDWMSGGDELDANVLAGLVHGLHALAMCDKALGGWSVLGDSTDLTAVLTDLAGLTCGVSEWSLSQVAFSGAKLCATLALSGNTTATIAINAAELAYKTYAG